MDELKAFLAPGLKRLGPDGKLSNEAAEATALDGTSQLVVFDLEMSGSNAAVHEVLEVGAILVGMEAGWPERAAVGTKVRPKRIGNAEPGALKVVGYTSKSWREAVELRDAFGQVHAIAAGEVLAGWGIGQDIAFLVEVCKQLGLPWPFASVAIDIQPIARQILRNTGQVDRFNLGHVADRLGIGRMGEHSALADAYATYDVLLKLFERRPGAADAP